MVVIPDKENSEYENLFFKRRTKYDIMKEILKIAGSNGSEGVGRSALMYKTRLSHGQLKIYVDDTLLRMNALEVVEDGNGRRVFYKRTDIGTQIMNDIAKINEFL